VSSLFLIANASSLPLGTNLPRSSSIACRVGLYLSTIY